jgi:hypothetical protein
MKLGFISEPTNNAYYRVVMPMRALERLGHTVLWPATLSDDVPLRELATCELVHCYRRAGRIADLRGLSRAGVAITFDNDDNFAAAEVSEGGVGLDGHRHNRRLFREMLKMAEMSNLTITPSEELAELYRRAGIEHVTVIENRLARSMPGFNGVARHDGVIVGWVAGREHSTDLGRIPIVDVLGELLQRHSALRVLTVGLSLPLSSDRYEHIPAVPLPQLLKVTSRMDVGIAPLADTPFNRSRSDVKLKEYASGGAAWLASPVGPYLGHWHKQGGVLVGDDEWLPAIDRLVCSSRTRRRLSRRGLRWAKQQVIENHTRAWEQAFQQAVTRRAENHRLELA